MKHPPEPGAHHLVNRRSWLVAGVVAAVGGCQSLPVPPPRNLPPPAPPGTVIAHSPAPTGRYIGSPSIAVLPDGSYVASHDFFGPASGEHQQATSRVYRSRDRGRSWSLACEIHGAFWSSLFVHRDALYLIGPDRHHGRVLIRRSRDGGRSWTRPIDAQSGVLRPGPEHHGAPVPVVEHQGRLWRAIESRHPPQAWGIHYRAGVMSVPVDADLLDARQWTTSDFLPSNRSWNDGDMGAWLEGNVVVAPDGSLANLMRVDTQGLPEKAAWLRVAPDGKTLAFDAASGFIDFPGGAKKFTVRPDPQGGGYWSVATVVPRGWHTAGKPARVRNTLALIHSPDLRHWDVRCHLLHHVDYHNHGFQYVDWLFDGPDLIAACRTAFDDAHGGAHNAHDANFLTFHRIPDFRALRLEDSMLMTRFEP
ncbi:MAG: sialidase family protein [Verrucomicrobiota bacterium]